LKGTACHREEDAVVEAVEEEPLVEEVAKEGLNQHQVALVVAAAVTVTVTRTRLVGEMKVVEGWSEVKVVALALAVAEEELVVVLGSTTTTIISKNCQFKAKNTDFGSFDDEETRSFYSDIPDYLTTIPPALLGLTVEAIEAKKVENTAKYGESDAEAEIEDADFVQDLPADAEELLEAEIDAIGEGAPSGEGGGKQTTTSCFIHVCCLITFLAFVLKAKKKTIKRPHVISLSFC
jgi:hypothetical protein